MTRRVYIPEGGGGSPVFRNVSGVGPGLAVLAGLDRRGYHEITGPIPEIARDLSLPSALVEQALLALEQSGHAKRVGPSWRIRSVAEVR